MKKLLFIISLIVFQNGYSQDAYSNYNKCMKSIDDWYHSIGVEKKYIEMPSGDIKSQIACMGYEGRCIMHHRTCSCNECETKMHNERKTVDAEYETRKKLCYENYKRAAELELEESRKKAEADNRDAEKQRIEKAKREKAQSEIAAKEKAEKAKAEKEKAEKAKAENEKSVSKNSKSNSGSSTNYVETPHDREIRQRYESQIKRDSIENRFMGTAIAGTAALMTYGIYKNIQHIDEDEDDVPAYLKATIGLGVQDIPISDNLSYGSYNYSTGVTTYTHESKKTTTGNLCIKAGLIFAILNDKFISFRLSPFFTYGMNAFVSDVSGSHTTYGSGASIGMGRKFKILLKGEFAKRKGFMTTDKAFLDVIGTAKYNYSTKKFGAGAFYNLGLNNYVEISAYKEYLSFLKNMNAAVYSYEIKVSTFMGIFAVEFAPNYPIAGEVKFPSTYKKGKQSYVLTTFCVPFKIF